MPRLFALIVALVMSVVLGVGAVAQAAGFGLQIDDVTCCCGPHAGDHDCGCADCPASATSAESAPDPKAPSGRAPSLNPCGPNVAFVPLAWAMLWVLPAPPPREPDQVETVPPRVRPQLPQTLYYAPDPQPPRART